jgi:hypothetical protein
MKSMWNMLDLWVKQWTHKSCSKRRITNTPHNYVLPILTNKISGQTDGSKINCFKRRPAVGATAGS